MSCPVTGLGTDRAEPFERDAEGAVQLFGAAYVQDPYPVFRHLTRNGPVHRVRFPSGVNAWLVTGADAAAELLQHPDIRKNHDVGNPRWRAKASIMPEPQHTRLQSHLLHQDGEVHARMRKLILPAFSARAATELEGRIADLADQLIDGFPDSGGLDLVPEYMALLPFRVLSLAIGLPPRLADGFDPAWGKVVQPVGPDDPWRPEYERLLRELEAYIAEVVADAARPERSGLLARLVRAQAAGSLSADQLSSLVFQLLVAGQEPVTHQLSTSMLALLQHPEARDDFVSRPESRSLWIDELIRYDGAFALATWRFFTVDTDFRGTRIPAGDSVIVALNAANRDLPGGDWLDFGGRSESVAQLKSSRQRRSSHFGFSAGPHSCPGAALAQSQLALGLGRLFDRLDGLALVPAAEPPSWIAAVLTRGLKNLPVSYRERLR